MLRIPLMVAFLVASLPVSCGDDGQTWPPTFGDYCYGDDTQCAEPFECLNADGTTEVDTSRCTKRCAEDVDCPAWHSSGGHAVGDFRSSCLTQQGICEPLTLK